MKDYILLLPVIFIFHDMEEIIGFRRFFDNNPWLYERFPKLIERFRCISTARFAMAVYEEFIPFFGVSLLAYYFPCKLLYCLWYGIFLSLAGHFFIHIGQALYVRKYIPCVITALICLPVSAVILIKAGGYMTFDTAAVIYVVLGIALMIANTIPAFRVMLSGRGADCKKEQAE